MTQKHFPIDPLALAASWRLLGLMFVAYARQIFRLERAGACGIWQKADTLEMLMRAALIDLNRKISECQSQPGTDADDPSLNHLRAIAAVLLALAMFVAQIKRRAKRHGAMGHALQHSARPAVFLRTVDRAAPPARSLLANGYIDTS